MSEAVANGENGLLFEKGNVSELARALERILEEPTLLIQLRKNARRPKTIAQYAADCAAVYTEITSGRVPAPAA
jgi:glycosyltransferase involved in cell wall biosynthesis